MNSTIASLRSMTMFDPAFDIAAAQTMCDAVIDGDGDTALAGALVAELRVKLQELHDAIGTGESGPSVTAKRQDALDAIAVLEKTLAKAGP